MPSGCPECRELADSCVLICHELQWNDFTPEASQYLLDRRRQVVVAQPPEHPAEVYCFVGSSSIAPASSIREPMYVIPSCLTSIAHAMIRVIVECSRRCSAPPV